MLYLEVKILKIPYRVDKNAESKVIDITIFIHVPFKPQQHLVTLHPYSTLSLS
jgi:hypothetical protein